MAWQGPARPVGAVPTDHSRGGRAALPRTAPGRNPEAV